MSNIAANAPICLASACCCSLGKHNNALLTVVLCRLAWALQHHLGSQLKAGPTKQASGCSRTCSYMHVGVLPSWCLLATTPTCCDVCRGRVTSVSTGQGAVRRMHFAPPSCSQLDHLAGSLSQPNLCARVCCLFVNGTFGVWEVDSRNELRAVSSPSTH